MSRDVELIERVAKRSPDSFTEVCGHCVAVIEDLGEPNVKRTIIRRFSAAHRRGGQIGQSVGVFVIVRDRLLERRDRELLLLLRDIRVERIDESNCAHY